MKRLFFSICITLAIIIIFFTQISLKDIFNIFIGLDPLWALLGAGFYIISTYFRALRFRWLIYSKEIPIQELFKVSIFYNLSIMILPSKLGELSFPYFLKKISGRSITEGLATLITSRVYDFFILIILLLLSSIGFINYLEVSSYWILFLLLILTLLTVILFLYINYILKLISNLLRFFSYKKVLSNWKLLKWIQRKINEIAEDFYAIKAKRKIFPVVLSSLISWIMIFFTFYAFIRGFGIKLPFLSIAFSSTLAIITSAIPISTFGNWGMLELGWTAGFLMAGLSKEDAIASGFGVHIILFLICLILACIFWFNLKR